MLVNLERLIPHLAPKEYEAVYQCYHLDKSIKEASKDTGLTVSALKNSLHRAKNKAGNLIKRRCLYCGSITEDYRKFCRPPEDRINWCYIWHRSPPDYRTPGQRFLDNIEINPETGCHEWTGVIHKTGYSVFHWNKSSDYGHRFSWYLHTGEYPPKKGEELEIDHVCGVRHCVNFEHLELVTHRENLRRGAYRYRKKHKKHWSDGVGTYERNKDISRKFTEQDICDIRVKYATGKYTQRKLSDIHDISEPHFWHVVKGKKRQHIPYQLEDGTWTKGRKNI